MARLDILTPIKQFRKLTGRNPTDKELQGIKQAVVIVPITVDVDDYIEYWEGEVAIVSDTTADPEL